ncbi:hypothetical protein C7B82_10575 [Stenomitos frigidus ULC18]|uniref:Chromosome segregation ATPase n=1 Tax=Stenomitos frigidus ULC18 TaxID=2107698 RepID=A0A2T1EAR6_9CYAN|nr:hypothetical protein C7B82_10575 [Stenomitos frigidus ULC18]
MFPTASSQISESQTSESQAARSQDDLSVLSIPELPSQETSITDLKSCPSTEPSRPNRMIQAVVIVVAIAMGLTVFSGVVYVILAKLEVLQRSQPSTVESTQPRLNQDEQSIPKAESPTDTQNGNEMQAKMLLDRARRLAVGNRFEDAIAEASKIPVNSLLYQQAQQAINQWSGQSLQQEEEQRALQQKLEAMHESNQKHLQLTQQALDQNDWETALQEVNQINANQTNQNSLWQQRRDDMVQKIEPYQHEHKAQDFLDDGELENAMYEANQLPKVAPWKEKTDIITDQVKQKLADKEVAKKWNMRCQTLTQNNISRCPNLDELKELVDFLPPARWLPRLNSPGRKSKH